MPPVQRPPDGDPSAEAAETSPTGAANAEPGTVEASAASRTAGASATGPSAATGSGRQSHPAGPTVTSGGPVEGTADAAEATEGADGGTQDADETPQDGGEPPATAGPYTFEDVSVVMGTYNEEAAIERVIADIERVTDGAANVVCVDGSSDRTPEIAREMGARVIEQEPQGYGVAVEAALHAADRPVVVTTDCDDTYPMERLGEFLDAINAGHDVASGNRLANGADAMPPLNRAGNHAFAALASVLLGERVRDVTTGMRAYRREVIESIEWTENTGLSAELLLRPAARGYDVVELPIEYRERAGETTLDPFAGGAAIATSILSVGIAERVGRD